MTEEEYRNKPFNDDIPPSDHLLAAGIVFVAAVVAIAAFLGWFILTRQ